MGITSPAQSWKSGGDSSPHSAGQQEGGQLAGPLLPASHAHTPENCQSPAKAHGLSKGPATKTIRSVISKAVYQKKGMKACEVLLMC